MEMEISKMQKERTVMKIKSLKALVVTLTKKAIRKLASSLGKKLTNLLTT